MNERNDICMKTILLIEDSEDIKKGLDYLFAQNDFLLLCANNLKKAKEYIQTKQFDLIILDVTLPDGNGFTFFKEMASVIYVPVIFLTANDFEDDVVKGLELGAVDYIVKPFRNRELLLRIHNALRFKREEKRILRILDIEIDLERMQILRGKKEIVLTPLEYKVFLFLVENAGRIVTRQSIMDQIWDLAGNYVNDNTLTVYIKRIREKLGRDDVIKTIKGIGYRVDRK